METPETRPPRDPQAQLERALIEEFLRARGLDSQSMARLPEPDRRSLLKDAALYAAAKLTEVEARARFVHELHGGGSEAA